MKCTCSKPILIAPDSPRIRCAVCGGVVSGGRQQNEPSKTDLEILLDRWIRLSEKAITPNAGWLAEREELKQETTETIISISEL